MRASRWLPTLNLFQGKLAPPPDGGGEWGALLGPADPAPDSESSFDRGFPIK